MKGFRHYYSGGIEVDNDLWQIIHRTVLREMGKECLLNSSVDSKYEIIYSIRTFDAPDALDIIDISFQYLLGRQSDAADDYNKLFRIEQSADDAVNELNQRFFEHGLGYQFVGGELVQVDSQHLHAEAVVPALTLLSDHDFAGAEEEFRSAHKHFRAGEYRDAIVDANNAFESTFKTICAQRGWTVPKGARASDLLKSVKEKGLFPDYLDASFEQLLAVLKSGLPKIRNEEGGHGQGEQVRETPRHVASFALHLAATKIVFLVECHKALG